jgi:hypothetical protein
MPQAAIAAARTLQPTVWHILFSWAKTYSPFLSKTLNKTLVNKLNYSLLISLGFRVIRPLLRYQKLLV